MYAVANYMYMYMYIVFAMRNESVYNGQQQKDSDIVSLFYIAM